MQQLTLTAPTKRPLTPAQWLLSSIAWTLASLAGWLALSAALGNLLDINNTAVDVLLIAIAAAAHLLIWYKAVLSTWDTVAVQTEPFWLSIVSACWTFVLVLFQLACLGVLFLALMLVFDQSSNGPWN